MKTKALTLVIMFMLGTFTLSAKEKKETFKVYGNCGMCKTRIEKAAKSVDGVSTAEWNKDTKMLEVKYDDSKTDLEKIEKAVADAGHDTDKYRAEDKVYANLPGCCHYDRAEAKSE